MGPGHFPAEAGQASQHVPHRMRVSPEESMEDGRGTVDHSWPTVIVRESHGPKYASLPVQAFAEYLRPHLSHTRMTTAYLWRHGHRWALSLSSPQRKINHYDFRHASKED